MPCPSKLSGSHCGDGMAQQKLLEFYKENLDRFQHIRILPDPYQDEVEKILQGSIGIHTLRKLCENNEEFMFAVLQSFLTLPMTRRLEQLEQKDRRRKKNKPRDINALITRLTKESVKHISNAQILDLDIDTDRLLQKASTWALYKVNCDLLGIDKLVDAINFVRTIDPGFDITKMQQRLYECSNAGRDESIRNLVRQDLGINNDKETSGEPFGFNEVLCSIYSSCKKPKGLSDEFICTCISKLLNSFKIQNKQGKNYTTKNISGIIKRALPPTS